MGPGRAFTLGYFSSPAGKQQSVRETEKKSLKDKVSELNDNASYVVVNGSKGIGKSCMIESAMGATKGVVYVDVAPGTLQKDVLAICFAEITGSPANTFINHSADVRRIIYFHRLFFKYPPTVVIALSEVPLASSMPRSLVRCARWREWVCE